VKNIKRQNALVVALAIIGVCAAVYGLWNLYQRHVVEEQSRAFFTAPTSPGIPDILHKNDAPPPPQP